MGALRRTAARRSLRIAALGAVVGAGALAGLLALSHGTSAPVIAPAAPVEIATSFDSPVVQFGDRVLARVVVALDTDRVQAQTLRFSADLAPLTQLGPPHTFRSTRGRLELVTAVVAVSCLSAPCGAHGGLARVGLPVVRASVRARNGRALRASAAWPTLSVRGRVTAADLAQSSPPFQGDTAPPTATYRMTPATLASLLDVLAVLSALGAIGLAAWQVGVSTRRRRPQPDALERALRLTREAENRPVPDRRRALAMLGRALGRDRRSSAARHLAWSEGAPEPCELEELVAGIEDQRPG
jgi:hypothetical protein